MKLVEFKDKFDGAPYTLAEFAEGARKIDDCEPLSSAATKYLSTLDDFEMELEKHIEIG